MLLPLGLLLETWPAINAIKEAALKGIPGLYLSVHSSFHVLSFLKNIISAFHG
jgi:hypothetical protein